jgi:hypothetical protein
MLLFFLEKKRQPYRYMGPILVAAKGFVIRSRHIQKLSFPWLGGLTVGCLTRCLLFYLGEGIGFTN